MIRSFADKTTKDIFDGSNSKQARKIPRTLWRIAQVRLDAINAAVELRDLRSPPGNRLEALQGDRKGQWSVRINDQYRIVFRFEQGQAFDVHIIDYHR